jgi:Ca2+:H+ antiporter
MIIRKNFFGVSLWNFLVPLAGCFLLAILIGRPLAAGTLALVAAMLIASVFVAVHHAEVVAHAVGEPFGTLILALAVTVIEVALIVSMMISGGPATTALARDTVFATVMIVCNGVVGICLLLGALRHHVMVFRVEGASPLLSVLITLTGLTLILPALTTSTPGPTLTTTQLILAGALSLMLYCVFVFVQTVRHRDYFLPTAAENTDAHVPPPAKQTGVASFLLLLIALVAVVGLAKMLAPTIEHGVNAIAAPQSVVGIAIALLVLLPESFAAVNAALRNRMQTSINLALGSAVATIGLSIPAVAAVSIFLGLPLSLGLPAKEMAMLALTLLVSVLTFASGTSTVLQGVVHLVLFATFLVLSIIP